MNTEAHGRLESLRGTDLHTLHASGARPDPVDLHGVLDGVVLSGHLSSFGVRSLRVWRGKVFTHHADGVTGVNRLGLGPLEVRRFAFCARIAPSAFGDREVVFLDHDLPGNPNSVRRFHDELVRIEDGLYLASSHHRQPDGTLRFLCHFALTAPDELV